MDQVAANRVGEIKAEGYRMTKFLLVLVWLSGDPEITTYRFAEYAECINSMESFVTSMTEQREVVLVAECFHVPPSWGL